MFLFQYLITGQLGEVEESFPRKLRWNRVAVGRVGGSVVEKLRPLGRSLQVKCVLWPWNSWRGQERGLVLRRTVLSPSWEDQVGLTPFSYTCSAELSLPTQEPLWEPCGLIVRYSGSAGSMAWGRWMCVCILLCGSPLFLIFGSNFLIFFLHFFSSFNWKGFTCDPPKPNT